MRRAAGTPEQLEAAAEAEKLKKQLELNDIKKVMGSKSGRRLMWRIIEEGNIFNDCFTGTSETYYLLGRRALALVIYADIMLSCPELFWQAQKENLIPDKKEV